MTYIESTNALLVANFITLARTQVVNLLKPIHVEQSLRKCHLMLAQSISVQVNVIQQPYEKQRAVYRWPSRFEWN